MSDPALLLVHAFAPPRGGGVGVVLHRLLRDLPGCRVEVLTDSRQREAVESGDGMALPGGYRYFRRLGGRWAGLLAIRSVVDLLNLPLALVAGARVARAARETDARWVMSVVDGAFSPLAAAIGAHRAGRPHAVMVFDPWPENAYGWVTRLLGRLLERAIFRRAAAIFVYCEQAAEHYARKHGVAAHVIRTPVEAVARASTARPDAPEGRRELLVGGAVYWAQRDAVGRLLRVSRRFADVTVTMIGGARSLRLRTLGPHRIEPSRSAADFFERLQQADVLYLGVGVKSRRPDVVRLMTPARLADYMAAGRPILVHAPRGSYAAEYARSEDFAEVVDEPDEGALAAGLRGLLDDPVRALERAERARRLAAERHLAPVVAQRLRALLDGVLR